MPAIRTALDHTGLFDGYPHPDHYEATKTDKELAKELKEWFEASYRFRLPWEWTWDLNRFMLKGDQLLGRHKITGAIIRLTAEDSKKLRSQNNILRPVARSLTGKLSRLIPTYTVNPATTDFNEQNGAKVADQVLQYVRRKEDLDLIYTQLSSYLMWAGNAFAQLCWDPMAGRKIAFCKTCNYFSTELELVGEACPQCVMQRHAEEQAAQTDAYASAVDVALQLPPHSNITPEEVMGDTPPVPPEQAGPLPPGASIPVLVEAREGDVRVIVRDPRDVFLPAGCTSVKDATRFCVRELVEVPEAKHRFPEFAQFIHADSMIATDRSTKFRIGMNETMNTVEDLKDHVFIEEFHERATEAYPFGRVIYMVNDIVVRETASPYAKLDRFPLYHFGFDPIEGELYCDSFITQAWHRQRELNRLETQLTEHIDQVLKPKLMNPFGTRISADEFTSLTGQVIDYNALAGAPEWQTVPDLAPGVWQRKQDIMADVRMLASVTESEQGMMGTDPNGRAAAIINAEADQQVGPIVQRNNSEWRELHRGIIVLYQEFAHEERIATIAGPEGLESFSFGELNLLQSGWDIQMEQEEGLSRNPAVRLTQAIQLAQIGFFIDSQTGMFDRQGFARYAKLRIPDAGYDKEATERAAASSIPYLIQQGTPWQPRQFDDPHIFQEVLCAWLRGPGRKGDPNLSAQVEQIWMFYMQWAMTGQAGPVPGQPGQPGAAGGQQAGAPPTGGSPAGGDMSAAGGSPNGMYQDIQSEAGANIQGADGAADSAAGAITHEN